MILIQVNLIRVKLVRYIALYNWHPIVDKTKQIRTELFATFNFYNFHDMQQRYKNRTSII